MHQTDVTEVIQRFTSGYRKTLLAKTGILAILGLGILAALAWRLSALDLSAAWRLGVPGALILGGLLALVWWLRTRWVSVRASPAYLDQAFGLQQRLITAAEFARMSPPAPLYPMLVEDTVHRLSDAPARLPRPLDRTAAALALLLFLLLAWPLGGRSPLQRLAQLPQMTPPSPSPTPPPPPSPELPQRQEESSSSAQQDAQGSSGLPAPPRLASPSEAGGAQAGGSEQSTASGSDQSSSGGESNGPQDASAGASPSAPSDQQAGGQQDSAQQGQSQSRAGSVGQQEPSPTGGRTSSDQQRAAVRDPGQRGWEDASKPSSGTGERGDRGSERAGSQQQGRQSAQGSGAQGTQPSGESAQRQAGARGGQGDQGQPGAEGRQGAQLASASSGNQDALKAEIQQLLKDVSGELKQLQAQLANADGQTHPNAGTSTDPQLYEGASSLDQSRGESLSVTLPTDTAPTAAKRPGGGVGRPSGEVAHASPSAAPEEADLSETPTEEPGATRQVVPPEYRSVFDRLQQQQRTQPNGTP